MDFLITITLEMRVGFEVIGAVEVNVVAVLIKVTIVAENGGPCFCDFGDESIYPSYGGPRVSSKWRSRLCCQKR